MEFHCETFGIILSTDGQNDEGIINMICSDHEIQDDGSVIVNLYNDLIPVCGFDFMETINNETKISFKHYEINSLKFTHKDDPRIM